MNLSNDYVYRSVYNVDMLIPVTSKAITRNILVLNSTAAKIIKTCDKFQSVDDITDYILKDVADSHLYRDKIIDYIDSLIDNGIIRKGDD